MSEEPETPDPAAEDHDTGQQEEPLMTDAEQVPEPEAPSPERPQPGTENLDVVLDLELTAAALLGGVEMPIGQILSLAPGSIIEMDRLVDEPIDLLVNDKLVARGEVVVVDEKFGVRITEVVSTRERIEVLQ
jgi:flagellar motor switch protein FliN/FliY